MQIPFLAGLLGTASINSSLERPLLTPERHISAPRPGNAVVNPAGTSALVGVKFYSFESDAWDETLYHVGIPANFEATQATSRDSKEPQVIAKGVTGGFWLDSDTAAYINATDNTLYAKSIRASITAEGWSAIGTFPTSIDTVQIARNGADAVTTIVFSAQVYGDGDIYAVKDHDKSKAVEEWQRVKGR